MTGKTRGLAFCHWEAKRCLTHGGACVASRELTYSLAPFSLVQEDLPVRSDARKMVSTWRVPDVLHELGVCLDCLFGGKKVRMASQANVSATTVFGKSRWPEKSALPYRTYREPLGFFFVLRGLVRRRTK